MASAQMRVSKRRVEAGSRATSSLGLAAAERSEEIYPLLLDEIAALGYSRALIATVNYDAAEIRPVVMRNCSRAFRERFTSSLHAAENPMVQVLNALEPRVVAGAKRGDAYVYCHPMFFRSPMPCLEADRERRPGCLGVDSRNVQFRQQVCAVCDLESFTALVNVELPRAHSKTSLKRLTTVIEVANRLLSRLYKTEQYFNRIAEMEVTIAQMQTVMESMADPVILTGPQHRAIMQNKAAERFFRASGNGSVQAVELNNMLFSAALTSMVVSGSDSSCDLTLVDTIREEEVLFEAVSAPSFTRDGRRTGNVTVMRDVTDLRRADEELRLNYERLRHAEELVRQDRDRLNLIVENVGDPIVVCNKDAKIVLLDPLAQDLFGSDTESRRSRTRLRNQAKLDVYLTRFTDSFSERESTPLRLLHPVTRQEVEYDARSGKIYDERGHVAFTVTVLRDLTSVRRVEQLKMERRLLEMEKFAAAGRLAGTIAHEVNNPLEAIKNCIFLLQNSVTAEASPVYEILKSETERVARIVRQMLGLYRNTEQVGRFDVNSVVEDTLTLFARQLERAGVRVESQFTGLPASVGSADQLRQVLSNLVVNAKDSMSQGGILHVRTRVRRYGSNEYIHIMVADTGCGIPPSMLHSMFEPFVSTKGERGTGLGLWIVKGIIENHGGKLRVKSKVNAGTVFTIDLPVAR
ncbi:MAG TPA: ATP-binding protein [Clostridia bacterium]|nr:ATP-binding protein [Clostridia bacterium]